MSKLDCTYHIINICFKKKRACALFLLEPIGISLALDFGLNDFILHIVEKDVLHFLVGEVLRQTFLRGGKDFLRRHIRGDGITQDGENLRQQSGTRIGTLGLSLGLGFVAGFARLGNLVTNLRENFHNFGGVFNVHGNGVDGDVQSVNAGDGVLHSKSLSGF